jgi:DNA polymerase (family 10)
MDKKQVAEILDEMGTLLEIKGANPFRCRAFHNAAINVESLSEDLRELASTDRLTEIPGIGKGIAQVIKDLVESGSSSEYEEIKKSLPPGLPELIKIPGLGPKRVKLLYEKLNIDSVSALEEAATTHRLSDTPGFGKKSEENILKGIARLSKAQTQFHINIALNSAENLIAFLGKQKGVKRSEIAGSLRRRKELIGDIDLLVSCGEKERKNILEKFVHHPDVQSILAQGDTKASVRLHSGIQCDLRVVKNSEFAFALNYFTGSKEHNVEVRTRARTLGLSLNEYGFSALKEWKKSKKVPICPKEEDIYKTLGLAYVPPELRENLGEFEAAEKNRIPRLVEVEDLRGTFHCHTTYSDGRSTLKEMAAMAKKQWEYWGVADHSGTAVYAHGLTKERIKEQHAEIDSLNSSIKGFRIFKGIECDILPDGSLDMNDDDLSVFDYVVASIHSKLNMSEKEATSRLIKALKNQRVTFVGHPTGRILLERDGYPVNIREVIDAAADYGKGLEINSHPIRLDLDWRTLRYVKEKKVKIFINPDAHSAEGLLDVRYGVGIARKGWLESADVVNTLPLKKVAAFFGGQDA